MLENRGKLILILALFTSSLCFAEYIPSPSLIRKIKRRSPNYLGAIIIDLESKKIIKKLSYKNRRDASESHLFEATHPAASIFKIITSAALLQNKNFTKDEEVEFVGKRTTLYKYQLKERKSKKWVRKTSLIKSFGTSNNVAFGKLAQQYLLPDELLDIAKGFGFGQKLSSRSNVLSYLPFPVDKYHLAEIASGFNREVLISIYHAALLNIPFLSKNHPKNEGTFLDQNTKDDLVSLMEKTVSSGTARKVFRRFYLRHRVSHQMGGKTGTITGGLPFGKRDWFVGFLKNRETGKGVALAVMQINNGRWFSKSTEFAKWIFQDYIRNEKNN